MFQNHTIPRILLDDGHPALDTKGMRFREFPGDYRKIRYYSLLIVQQAPLVIKELNLLEQQISEILKNGIRHGNKNDPEKTIKVWYRFSEHEAQVVVQDQGEGFKDLEKWNTFNQERAHCLDSGDWSRMADYASWRGINSTGEDGGNALFAAVEYWNGGYVFNSQRNTVGALKIFPRCYYNMKST